MSTLSLLVSSLFSICLSVTPLGSWKSGGQASKHLYKNQAVMTACGYQNVASYLNGVSPHPSHTSLFPFGYVTAVGTVSAGSQYENLFNDGYGCGACYEVKCTGIWGNAQAGCVCNSDTVIVQAIDLSANNPEPHFDIAFDGFDKIAGSLCGRVAIDYRQVACEFTNNIYITTDNSSDAWSYYLNFYNVAGDGKLCKVEMKSGPGGSGNWKECENISSKFKWICMEIDLPLSFRLTDCAGNSIIATDAVNAYGSIPANLGVNFPVTPVTIPTTPPTPPPVTIPTTLIPPPTDCTSTTRCGAYWGDANSKCGQCCSNDGHCTADPSANLCYAHLSTQPCTPPPTHPPVTPTLTGLATISSTTSSCGKQAIFTTQEGSGKWWLTFRIADLCCGNVTKVESKDANLYPTFLTATISQDGTREDYWIFDSTNYDGKSWTGPITVRVTNSFNETLTFTDILDTVQASATYYSDINFQNCPTTTSSPGPPDPTNDFNVSKFKFLWLFVYVFIIYVCV